MEIVVSQVESTNVEVRTEHAQAHTEQAETQDEEESAGTDLLREFQAIKNLAIDLPRPPKRPRHD